MDAPLARSPFGLLDDDTLGLVLALVQANGDDYFLRCTCTTLRDKVRRLLRGHRRPTPIGSVVSSLGRLRWVHALQRAGPEWLLRWDWKTSAMVARAGALEVLRWVRARGCSWCEHTCTCAARGGHVDVLRWARHEGCRWNHHACSNAAAGGHLEALRWAREHGCAWTSATCRAAAEHGHLAVLQWARLHGCPWDSWVCADAAHGGHMRVLRWARANGCPWDEQLL
jgi:hypothetical protein